jgi:glycosyltransferase involved in cell wall biosynthesis
MQMKTTTILVAAYNKKETIKNCLDSLLDLDYLFEKILILDGGSKDGTYEILQEYQQKYPNKIDLRQMLIGHSDRINWALDNIKTEYVALTDADCVVEKDWLDKLLAGFDQEQGVIATAGYCGTPKDVLLLQKLIGLEMDNRFNRLPRYLYRAPTMNLCLKTDIAKKVRFDEKQKVAIETDFGFRLTKHGKMLYCPGAKVWHCHRSSLKDFFKQQSSYAKWGVRLIFRHKARAISDPITGFGMIIQIPLLIAAGISFLLGYFNKVFFLAGGLLFLLLFLIYIKNLFEIHPPIKLIPALIGFFLFRTIAWVAGVFNGIFLLIRITLAGEKI